MHIIMNPPYSGNLHLKIVSKIISEYPNAEIVNLSPIKWLQDPLAEYKKNSNWKKFEDIRKHIQCIQVIPIKEANELFSIDLSSDLGIYQIIPSKTFNFKLCDNILASKLISLDNFQPLMQHLSKKPEGLFLKFRYGVNTETHTPEDKKNFCVLENFESATTYFGRGHTLYLNNLTKEEQVNAHKFYTSLFMRWWNKYICSGGTNYNFTPIIDFTHHWTDEQIYKYFELTDEEIKEIECSIKNNNL